MEQESSLKELADYYFKRNRMNELDYNYKIDNKRKFDIVITQKSAKEGTKNKKIGVFVCDIHRSIGLNVLRKIQHMLEDTPELTDAILVGKDFSSQVRKFNNSYDVKLLSKSQIKRNLEARWEY